MFQNHTKCFANPWTFPHFFWRRLPREDEVKPMNELFCSLYFYGVCTSYWFLFHVRCWRFICLIFFLHRCRYEKKTKGMGFKRLNARGTPARNNTHVLMEGTCLDVRNVQFIAYFFVLPIGRVFVCILSFGLVQSCEVLCSTMVFFFLYFLHEISTNFVLATGSNESLALYKWKNNSLCLGFCKESRLVCWYGRGVFYASPRMVTRCFLIGQFCLEENSGIKASKTCSFARERGRAG